MKKVLGDFVFGFDLEEIGCVMEYLKGNYKSGKDFKMWIEIGDDVMNGLEVFSEDLMEDEKFCDLIKKCDGEGNFNEEDMDEEDMDDES
jgi:hypothetical protein